VTIYLNLINDINIDIIFKPFILKINPCAKSIPRFSPPPTKFAVIGSAMVILFVTLWYFHGTEKEKFSIRQIYYEDLKLKFCLIYLKSFQCKQKLLLIFLSPFLCLSVSVSYLIQPRNSTSQTSISLTVNFTSS
jgi:hypothetical protein